MAKKPPQYTPIKSDPVTHYTIGKGISKIPMVSVDFTRPGLTVEDLDRVLPKGIYTFEGRVAFAEKWATKILQEEGLPANPKAEVIYEKNGTKWRGTALSSLETEERVSERWYAAEILSELHLVRTLIERGETAHAAHRALDLGMLLRELYDVMLHNKKVLAWEKWAESGLKGEKPKSNPVILRYVKSRLRSNSKLTERDLWEELEQYDPIIQYEKDGDHLFVDKGKLYARRGGKKHIIERSSFPRYVTIARGKLIRPRTRMK